MKVVDYQLVSEFLPEKLTATVQGLLKQGWQPWGNPVIQVDANNQVQRFAQAMVKSRGILAADILAADSMAGD